MGIGALCRELGIGGTVRRRVTPSAGAAEARRWEVEGRAAGAGATKAQNFRNNQYTRGFDFAPASISHQRVRGLRERHQRMPTGTNMVHVLGQ